MIKTYDSKQRNNILIVICFSLIIVACNNSPLPIQKGTNLDSIKAKKKDSLLKVAQYIDSASIIKKLKILANGDTSGLWPIKSNVFPLKGAILPFKRVIAFYGNLYSKKMGILGEYPPEELWKKIKVELENWRKADSLTPLVPAIHYIVTVAQGTPTNTGFYCTRMPQQQIDSVLSIAKMGNAIVFLDIQVGQSNLRTEVLLLEKYLKIPNVHLAIDPEFSMKDSIVPGKKIGKLFAEDINYCVAYLQDLVKKNRLSPKILIVHRFTQGMVKNYQDIELCPEVQIVMNMDGWGCPELKLNTYNRYIYKEPVQFTGFKLFYKNDIKKFPNRMLTPSEILKLKPQPVYIQYQ